MGPQVVNPGAVDPAAVDTACTALIPDEAAVERVVASGPAHPLADSIPPTLRPWLLGLRWDQRRLWDLELPTTPISVAALRWHYTLPWWRHNDTWFQITPQQVIDNPTAFPEHQARIGDCDLRYPVHVTRRRGRWLILDGIHRLVRADLRGDRRVAAHPVTAAALRQVIA